ncbi:NACHT domain-containing protein [Psychromonas sp.]|uniref:NACHT domain-containing protein n=1 Tax=Psychromonas sp. TaxID=1884585 RepID=UPI003A98653E
MKDLKATLSRLSNYLNEYEKTGKPNDARKMGESICKIILLSSTIEATRELSKKSKYQELIDSLSKKHLDINENHLKKIKSDLKVLQDFGNVDSHDNEVEMTSHDTDRIRHSVKNLFRNVFDAKEHLDIDHCIPISIYKYISKNIAEIEDWKCIDIISTVYPNRDIKKLNNNKEFEFYSLSDVNNKSVGYVLLGRNISFSSAFKTLFDNYTDQIKSLISVTFLFPKEISKTTGLEVKNRKNSIVSKCSDYEKKYINIDFTYHFIEDYIWDYCLINILKNSSNVTTEPFFIDQWLYKEGTEKLSLEFLDEVINHTSYDNKPIHIILGDGGVGKTTFCLQAVQKIDQLLSDGYKKKALLLSSFDLPDELSHTGEQIDSIQSLYHILQDDPDYTLDPKNLALNISSGNLLIIVDGLDEIESKLKERFNLELFFDSVVALNDTYQNCSVLITSRDNKSERFDREKVNIYQLKGFSRELTEKYLGTRYGNKSSHAGKGYDRKVLNNIEKMSLDSKQNVTPLILRLLCELVESENNNDFRSGLSEYKYFIMSEPLDKVMNQIIMRDILKQGINISCDDYFEILKDIVFDYNCMISKQDLDELLECALIGTNIKDTGDYTSFYVSPLFNRQGDCFKIKHDSLEFWVKSRYITNKINLEDKNIGERVLALIARDCYRGGALVDDIKCHKKSGKIDFLRNFIEIAIKNIVENNNEDTINFRKMLSSISYLSMPKETVNKEQYSATLLRLFGKNIGSRLNYLSIYGEFFPLDFKDFSVSDGYFNGYSNLSKSNIPTDKTIFIESEFVDIDISQFGKSDISSNNFQDCILPDDFEKMIKTCELTVNEQIDTIKVDLKKIFKVGFRQNSFVWKTEQLYKQQCTSMKHKLKLSKYLDVLMQQGFLLKESAKGSSGIGYRLNKTHEHSVKDFITQGILAENINTLIDTLHSK